MTGHVPRRIGHDGCLVGSRALSASTGIGRRCDGPCVVWRGDTMAGETIAWFVGVDWASEKHQACLLDAQGSIVGEREFAHSAVGLAELGDWILSIAGAASTV